MSTSRKTKTPEPEWILVPAKPTIEWIEAIRKKTSWPQVALAIELVLSTAPKKENT